MVVKPWATLVAWFGFILLPGSALAGDPATADGLRLAIKGYDPVAYFSEGRPVQGTAEFEEVWERARWRFASAANRDRFKADPDRYAPQYAGYCAYGMAKGAKFEIDPEAWTIVDGKLYLNNSKDGRKDWAKARAENIKNADANWPLIGAR
jgi:hypothetical protein